MVGTTIRDILIRIRASTKSFINKIREPIKKLNELAKTNKKVQTSLEKIKGFFGGFRGELLSMGFLFGMIGAGLLTLTRQALNSFGTLGSALTRGRLAFIEMQAQLKNLFFQFGESDAMKDFLNGITDMLKSFDELDPAVKNAIFAFILWGGVIASALGILSFMALGIFGIILFITQWGGVTIAITSLLKKLGFAAGTTGGIIKGLAIGIGKLALIIFIAAGFINAVSKVFKALGKVMGDTSDETKKTGEEFDALTFILRGLEVAMNLVGDVIFGTVLVISTAITLVITLLLDLANAFIKTQGVVKRFWEALALLAQGKTDEAAEKTKEMASIITDLAENVLPNTGQAIEKLGGLWSEWTAGVVENRKRFDEWIGINKKAQTAVADTASGLDALRVPTGAGPTGPGVADLSAFGGAAATGIQGVSENLSGVFDEFEVGFGGQLESFESDFESALDSFATRFENIFPALGEGGGEAFNVTNNITIEGAPIEGFDSDAFATTISQLIADQLREQGVGT